MSGIERLSNLTLDSIDRPLHVVDSGLVIRIFNKSFAQWCAQLGLKCTAAIGKTVFEAFPFLPERVHDEYRGVLQTGETVISVDEIDIQGRMFVTETRKIPLFEAGEVTHVITIITDITERRRAEEALRESEERFRTQFQSIPLPTLIWKHVDDDFILAEFNNAANAITEGKLQSFLGNRLSEMYAHMPEVTKNIHACLKNKATVRWEGQHDFASIRKEGYYETYGVFISPDQVLVHAVDLSERTRTEKALRDGEERFRSQFQSIPVPTYIWKHTGDDFVLTDYNDAAVEITKGNISSYLGKLASDMYGHMPELVRDMKKCLSNKATIRRELLYKFMSVAGEKYLDVHYGYIPPDQVLVHTVDLSDRRRAEQALQSARDNLEKRVNERTQELAQANELLMAEHKALEQKNLVLQEVLSQIEKGKEQLVSQIQMNINRVTLPILDSLEVGLPDAKKPLVMSLKNSLNDITSPLLGTLETKFPKLTPRELEICQMIKTGLNCKGIARGLDISPQTVLKHRAVIRKKLRIAHHRVNLASFLRTLK